MTSSEVSVTTETARRLLVEQAPDFAGLPLVQVARGWDNVMFRLGDDLAVRLPHRASAAHLVESETVALRILAPRILAPRVQATQAHSPSVLTSPVLASHLPTDSEAIASPSVLLPETVFLGSPSTSARYPFSWSVVKWVPGRSAVTQSAAERRPWASTLGRILAAIHTPDDAALAHRNPYRGTALTSRREAQDPAVLNKRLHVAPESDRPALHHAWSSALAAPPHTEPPVWLHGDPHPGNLVVGAESTLAGVIDWGDATSGDPASDLGALWLTFDAEGRQAVRDVLNPVVDTAATWQRAAGWAFLYSTSIAGHPDRDPSLVADARRALAELATA
ncbi:MAG: phosphotransferase [Cellulomonadaceae bacterium]|jgi:aminoglycoside phosphotransferase (APT) family kinase protein|nr:phosphotransferase [Cellulomonadaceae bacterium]